ncbi:MAG: hypothetical protein AAGK97_05565 [Bacteroidota bacterium]
MKNHFLLLILSICFITLTSCNKEEDGLEVQIAGEYLGAFASSATGNMDNFMIEVIKAGENKVTVLPANGAVKFSSFTTDLEMANNNTIIAINQPEGCAASFSLETPGGIAFNRIVGSEVISFVGVRQ